MQTIPLVPYTKYTKSIYTSDKKNCNGGTILLEDLITEYYMDIQSTTSVSIDTRLLTKISNSTMKFTLTIYSTGINVLNLSGFNVDQIQVWDGISVFTVTKGVGDANWNIQMTSSDVRPEQWLRCYQLPFNPVFNTGVFNCFNLNGENASNLFSKHAPGQQADDNWNRYYSFNVSPDGYICTKFPMPVWLKSICIAVTIYTDVNINNFPTSLQVYGSNDGGTWTQILNTALTPNWGSVDTYMCSSTNYYTMFKYVFGFPNNASNYYLPFISLTGFSGELIGTGAYSSATPYTDILPINGYNVETNSSDMYEVAGDIYKLTMFEGGYYYYRMTRSTDVPWEYIYTFPEAIRTIGIIFKSYEWDRGSPIKLFSLSYSDDKSTWTEYCKVDGSLNAWNAGTGGNQLFTYFYDSVSEHRYYKITVYSRMDGGNTLEFGGLGFLQFQKGHYFTFESFVPKLSTNSQAGYILISSNSSQGDPYRLFDQSLSSYGGGDISNGEWSLIIKLPQATVVRGLEMVPSPNDEWDRYYDRMPCTFSIQGSQDSETWTNIKTFTLGTNYWTSGNQVGQWDIENDTAYLYYRLVVTATANGSVVRIGELGLSSYASFKGVNWYEDEYLVPVMSSNSQDGYIVSASSESNADYVTWHMFDRNSDTSWSTENNTLTATIQIQMPTAKLCNLIEVRPRPDYPYLAFGSLIFFGSNDGSTWTELYNNSAISAWIDNVSKTWEINNSTAYSYYKLEVTPYDGIGISVADINLINRITHESN